MILNDCHTEVDTSTTDDQPDSIPLAAESVATFEVHASTPSLLRLCGELDLASAPILARAIAPATTPGATIELDLTALTFIDSSGIKVLCHALRDLGANGRLIVRHPRPPVRRTLQLTGLDGLIQIADTATPNPPG